MTKEDILHHFQDINFYYGDCMMYADLSGMLDELISEIKSEWIPVSERLPEMGVRVLCACQADLYDVLKLTPDGWFYDTRHTYMFGFVKAWQPLPEPYMENENQTEKDILHKAIDNTKIAEDVYPNLRKELHEAVDSADMRGDT